MKKSIIKRMVSCAGCLFYLVICLSGCASGTMLEEEEVWNIGVVLKTMDSEHWRGIRSGMENSAKQNNVNLTLFYPSNEWAEDEQEVMVRDIMESEIDALIIAPCNSTNTGWIVDLAKEKGIELFTVDTRSLDRDIPYIGIDNMEVGKLAAQCLDQNLPDNAKMAMIAGGGKQAQTVDRIDSFQKELKNIRGIEKDAITITKGYGSYTDALHVTKELINDGVEGLFCASAVMGLGAAASAEEMGKDICIVAIDTQDDAIKAVQRGDIDGLIAHSGYEVGRTAVETVAERLEDGPNAAKNNVYISCELMTKENIEEYLD